MGTMKMDPHHVHHFWGLSAPLDLKYLTSAGRTLATALGGVQLNDAAASSAAPLKCLQIAASDPRHTMTTLARAWRRQAEQPVEMVVWEPSLEGLARHMLLLSIMLDTELTARDRMEIFLEVYGNSKLREKTAEYVEERGRLLETIVTESNIGADMGPLSHLFDLSGLKFKEKDELSEVLRGYSRSADFHMDAAWEWRCRKYYGERYDHLRNLVDWDYHMRLVAADERASIVNFRQWREWRATGVAFEIRDSNFTEPNRTLLSTAVGRTVEFRDRNGEERGRSVSTRGLYCDLLCSPYLTLGVDCAETFLFKKANKQHVKTACDIAEFNLTALWHELYHAEKLAYVPTAEEAARFKDTDDDGTAAAAAEVPAAAPAEPKLTPVNEDGDEDGDEEDAEVAAAAARALAAAARFKVKLVTGDLDKNVLNKGGFKGAFDVVTLGMTMTHRVKEGGGLGGVAKAEGVLAMEDARFWMCLTKEQEAEFRRRVDELAVEAGWKPLGECVGVAPEHHLFSR